MKGTSKIAFNSAIHALTQELRQNLAAIAPEIQSKAQEVRLRVNCPVSVFCGDTTYFLGQGGSLCHSIPGDIYGISQTQMQENFNRICDYAIYSHEQEIQQGYVTIKGGHRVGIAGTAVISNNEVSGIRDVTSLNIRVARQIFGAADDILGRLKEDVTGTLLVGPPSCGKTTILRDIARQLSLGIRTSIKKVTIIDQRGEIAAVYQGVPQNDAGLSDVLAAYPKGTGTLQALRALSPQVIICDEIGSRQDVSAIKECTGAGVGLIASIHAGSIDELLHRSFAKKLLKSGAFKNIVLLSGTSNPGGIAQFYKQGIDY